jgi:tellurite resistance protein TerC
LTGFIIEKSLAIDNIFVFILVFSYFNVPAELKHRVLFYGILGALFFRAIFIALGSVLMQYHFVILIFGVFLIVTGVKMMFSPETKIEPEKNPLIKLIKKFLPVTPNYVGDKFFTRINGVLYATPLFVALVFIEFTDIIFAVDSVPAIFAITKEPLIVFTSNIFAILGLRAMYFLLDGVMDKFRYLKYGLGLVLIFVGLKMAWLNEAFGGKFPISWSLGIIGGIIGLSILISLIIPVDPKKES